MIYIVLNLKGGLNGDITFIVCSFHNQTDAENYIKGKDHLTFVSCTIE